MSAEQAEDYARDEAYGGCDIPNVLDSGYEWDEEDTEYEAGASKVEFDEFDEDDADYYRVCVEKRFKKPKPVEAVDLDKLTDAGWKVNLKGSGLLKGKVHHVFVIQEGETIGHHGWGDTIDEAVRDAAQVDQKLTDALAV